MLQTQWVNLVLAGDPQVGLLRLAQKWSPEMTPLDGYSMYHANNMVQIGICTKSQQPPQVLTLELQDEAYLHENVSCSCPLLQAESSKREKMYRCCPSCRKVRLSSRLDAELERVLLHMTILSAGQMEENPHLSPLVLSRVDVLCLCYTIGDRLSLDNAIHKVGGCLLYSSGTGSQIDAFLGSGIL